MILHSKYISTWLILNISMVILMIIIGGITRLTDSGLSMVEWRPIMGFFPPISELDWKRVFDLYIHDSWDGNFNNFDPDQPDAWFIELISDFDTDGGTPINVWETS